jgi:lipopolysaccharide transport system ATP-binding protein
MYTRLAFSVAAHLDPDVLVIDEVLAVGDAAFQKKCLGKMNDVSRQGRTVLFVSHNMAAVEALCGRGILLDRGRVLFDGPVREAVGAHMARLGGDAFSPDRLDERVAALPQDCEAVIRSVALRQDGRSVGTISNGCELEVLIEVEVKRPLDGFRIVLDLCDAQGNLIARSSHDEKTDSAPDVIRPGHYQARFTLPEAFLGPATYGFAVALATARGWLHGQRVEAAVPVVNDCAINRTRPRRRFEGKVLINGDWVLEVERQNQPRAAVR